MKKVIISLFFVFIFSSSILCQDRTGKFGLAILGDPFNPTKNIGISYWKSENLVIEPVIGYSHVNSKSISSTNSFRGSLTGKYYINKKFVDPYIGLKYGYYTIFSKDNSFNDILIGLVGGAEYFFSEWFSAGWEFQFSYINTDDKFSPSNLPINSNILETTQTLILKIYFN